MIHSVPCPCCHSVSELHLSSKDSNRKLSNNIFHYYKCKDCELTFIHPVPEDLARFYHGGFQPIPTSINELRSLAADERYRLNPVMTKAGGTLLEIGPWIGLFSINAKDAGFKVEAVEINEDACTFLRDIVGIEVTCTDNPLTVLEREQNYDVIALWHSLEHLPEPWRLLEAAAKRLNPGGILLIAIPNIGSWQARTFGSSWLHLDAPRHLYFWPPEALARLMNRYGLETVSLDTSDRLSDTLSYWGWEKYFVSLIRVPLLRGLVARIFSPFASRISQRLASGAGLTATFKVPKPGS